MFTGFASFFTSHINQYKSNYQQGGSNLSVGHDLIKVHSISKVSSAQTAAYVATIASKRSLVNINGLEVIKAAANQTTAKLEQIAEKTLICALLISKGKFINNIHSIKTKRNIQYV